MCTRLLRSASGWSTAVPIRTRYCAQLRTRQYQIDGASRAVSNRESRYPLQRCIFEDASSHSRTHSRQACDHYVYLDMSTPWLWVLCHLIGFARLMWGTGWRRLIGCLQLQFIFRKRATNCMALLRKMTYEDKASYDSTPPGRSKCTSSFLIASDLWIVLFYYLLRLRVPRNVYAYSNACLQPLQERIDVLSISLCVQVDMCTSCLTGT